MADAYLQQTACTGTTWVTWASQVGPFGGALGQVTQAATTTSTWYLWAQAGAMQQQVALAQAVAPAAGAESIAKQRAAEAKARALLLSYLDDEQRAAYEATEEFFVTAPSGSRFRFKKHERALEYKKDAFGRYSVKFRHCLVSEGNIPDEDRLLHMKVLLTVDERKFRQLSVATAV